MPKLAAFEDWTPPWGEDDEKIDPAKVKKLVYNLLKDKETLQGKVTSTETERDELKAKVDEAEQKDLNEVEKLKRENEKLKNQAPKVDDLELARLEIALDKGFTKAQAKRLVGKNREELEADAEELVKDLGLKQDEGQGGGDGQNGRRDDNSDVAQAVRRLNRDTPRRTGFEDRNDDENYDPAELIKHVPRR